MASSSESESPLDPSPHPVDLRQIEGLDVKARYGSPRCGGDFFDAVALDSRLVFLLTDIAGRRPETHAIAIEIQKVFRSRARDLFTDSGTNESEGIALLARDINHALIEAAGGIRYAPSFLGCYNLTLNILTYHYAGHFFAFFHDGETARVLDPGGIPLGLFTHSTYEPAVLAFGSRARLLLVTKGNSDGGNAEGRRRPTKLDDRAVQSLLENSTVDAESICEAVLEAACNSGKKSGVGVRRLLRPRKRKHCDDVTSVALVRGGEAPAAQTR